MNARDIAIAEAKQERMWDAAIQAAEEADERREATIRDIVNDMPRQMILLSREERMMRLYDWEFGGEYFLADLMMTYSIWKRGMVSTEVFIRSVDKQMQAAIQEQAKWEARDAE